MSNDLLFEMKDRTVYLTLNREARRNAISREMIADLMTSLDRVAQDKDVRAVCITGAGSKAFCAGADLSGSLADEGGDKPPGARNYAELLKKLSWFKKPLVARVNGPCLAGGLGLMLSCDIVIARDDAFFCTPEVGVGIFPMMIGALLYRNLGRKKATEMVLTGRRFSPDERSRLPRLKKWVSSRGLFHRKIWTGRSRNCFVILFQKAPWPYR
jgi:enoyl-CoA hydratase/carnithine racemase